MAEKVIFVAFSMVDRIKQYVMNILIVLTILYLSFYLKDNPVLISIIIFILLIILIMPGYNQLKVYEDRIEMTTVGLIQALSSKKKISINTISSINADLKFDQGTFFLSEILPMWIATNSWNTINFKLIDGTQKTFEVKLYKKDILKAIFYIKKLSNNRIAVSS